MLQKLFVIAVLVSVSAFFFTATTGYADATASDIDLDIGISYEGKGVSGRLAPHFSDDPAIGGDLSLQWREFRVGVRAARYLGLFSLIGGSGHTTFSADMRKEVGDYDLDVAYSYVRMESSLPSWWPWRDGNRHELFLKAGYYLTDRLHPYALAGGILAGDAVVTIGGVGSVIRFPLNRRVDFIADGYAATSLLSHNSGDRTAFGKVSGSLLITFQSLPISLKTGLNVFKQIDDEYKVWTALAAHYTF